MTFERADDTWGRSLGFAVVSIAAHVLLALLLRPLLPRPTPPDETDAPSEQPFEVGVVQDPDPQESPDEPEPPEPPPTKPKPEKPKPEPQKKQQPRKRNKLNRKTVDQQTNQKNPEEAEFLSNEANQVDKQRRARETTNQDRPSGQKTPGQKAESEVESGAKSPRAGLKAKAPDSTSPKPPDSPRPPPKPKQRQRRESTPRAEESKPKPPSKPTETKPSPKQAESTDGSESSDPKRPRKPLPMPTASDYEKIFDESDASSNSSSRARANEGVGHEMFQRIEKSKGSLKATLENYITEVKPGNHTSVNAKVDKAASYINEIHRKIHPRWGGNYLPSLAARFGPGHPMNDPNLNTELEFVIDGDTGELKTVNIVESSGQTMFDSEAILISEQVAPHSAPPDAIVSPDGNVYMHWNFWRDQRQCGTFGVSVFRVNQQGERTSASN